MRMDDSPPSPDGTGARADDPPPTSDVMPPPAEDDDALDDLEEIEPLEADQALAPPPLTRGIDLSGGGGAPSGGPS